MAAACPARLKRTSYVSISSEDSEKIFGYLSSDEDNFDRPIRKKVRRENSILELKKNSECFKTDEDHLYTKPNEGHDEHSECGFKKRLGNKFVARSNSNGRAAIIRSKIRLGDLEDVSRPGKRPRCFSKNAMMARMNRERKKKYVSSLEADNASLLKQKNEILEKIKEQGQVISALQHEILYLKSLLANSEEISQILKTLKKSTGLPVSTSLQTAVPDNSVETGKDTGLQNNTAPIQRSRVKTITSGPNFPILQKDVYLSGYNSNVSKDNELSNDNKAGLPFCSDNFSLNDNFLSEDYYESNASLFDIPFDPLYDYDCDLEKSIDSDFEDGKLNNQINNNVNEEVGLCLHVSNKKISLELCSICNSRAKNK